MHTPKTEYEKGVTLLLAVIVVSIVLSIGLNLSVLATKELGFARLSSDSVKAHYAAESALECAIFWMFQNTEFFSLSETKDIFCNDETISVGGGATSVIEISGEDDQYAAVEVRRDAPYDKRNFTLSSEGFNEDPTAGVDPNLVQQELGAISIENCEFNPDDADTGGIDGNPIVVNSDDLRNTFTTAFGNEISINDNTGYQTWRVGNNVRAVIIMETIALSSEAAYTNTFGFYTNIPSSPYANSGDIYAADAFKAVFSNRPPANNFWNADQITENNSSTTDWEDGDWKSFKIEVEPGGAIAFGTDVNHASIKSTEKSINGNQQWALAYDVPEHLWHDPEVPEYILAFEDQTLSGLSADYDDMVAIIRVKSCLNTLQRY